MSRARSLFIRLIGCMGGYQLARLLTQNQPKILMYHRFTSFSQPGAVSVEKFRNHLALINRYFHPMTLVDLTKAVNTGKKIPKNVVVITVDDGYRDFYELAFPLLQEFQIPATFFVTTGFVNGDLWLWPDQVSWLLYMDKKHADSIIVSGNRVDLTQPKKLVWRVLIDTFLSVSNSERLLGIKNLAEAYNVTIPQSAPNAYAAVNWEQLSDMQQNGIEIGGHTVTHPSLGRLSSEDAKSEVKLCFDHLKTKLGERPRTFCYPNGGPEDYNENVKNIVSESGFVNSVTAFSDKYNVAIPFAWRRFAASEDSFQLNKSLFGTEHLGNVLRNIQRGSY